MQTIVQMENIDLNVNIYVNRLSDFLFVAARYIAKKENKKETIYKKESKTD